MTAQRCYKLDVYSVYSLHNKITVCLLLPECLFTIWSSDFWHWLTLHHGSQDFKCSINLIMSLKMVWRWIAVFRFTSPLLLLLSVLPNAPRFWSVAICPFSRGGAVVVRHSHCFTLAIHKALHYQCSAGIFRCTMSMQSEAIFGLLLSNSVSTVTNLLSNLHCFSLFSAEIGIHIHTAGFFFSTHSTCHTIKTESGDRVDT